MPKPTELNGTLYDLDGISSAGDAFVVYGLADSSALNAEGDQWFELTPFGVVVHNSPTMGTALLPWHLLSHVRLKPAKLEDAKKGKAA